MKRYLKKIVFLVLLFFTIFFNSTAFAQVASQGVTVDVNVLAPSGGGGGGGGGSQDRDPSIFNVSTSTSYTSANISWSASDDRGIATMDLVYGTSVAYGSTGTVTDAYQTNIVGLATGTLYYFKISVTDTGSHTVDFTGQFSTSPTPPDIVPPVISNVQVAAGITTTTIAWSTNELADSQIIYGVTDVYGSNFFDPSQTLAHSVLLFNLSPNTTFHFQIISTDSAGNGAHTTDAIFTTAADIISPPDVSNFLLATTTNSIILSWVNPSVLGVPDFSGVRVVRKIGSASVNPADGVVVYTGTGETTVDTSVVVNTDYFYTIFSFDTSGNTSPGIFRNGKIILSVPPAEICGNGIDDNANGLVDCADMACAALSQCANNPPPTSTPAIEICGNGIDDNANGLVDCADMACAAYAGCSSVGVAAVCANNIDDDGDGLVDFPNDHGCESIVDTDEYNAPESTVPSFERITLEDLRFLAGGRNIPLSIQGDTVKGLFGAGFSLAIAERTLYATPQTMTLRVGDTDRHQFVFNAVDNTYYADLSFAKLGVSQAFLEVDYGEGQLDSVGFKINTVPLGIVKSKEDNVLDDVEVSLFDAGGNLVPMGSYGQLNPIISNENGAVGWMVPNGNIRVALKKIGFYERSLNIVVIDNIINSDFVLVAQPENVLDLDLNVPLSENIKNVIGALAGQTKALSGVTVQKIQDLATNPEVKNVNEKVVAPAVITVVVAGAAPLISWLDFLPFLRMLFLQPLMLLGWRKREKWGLVYNSLSKLPVDLAMVRLVNADTGKVVQSKVTDAKGHFIFMVGPGKYRLHIQKNSFIFPSQFLHGYNSDGQKAEIYHGEIIEVTAPTSITATIPLDPVGAQKKPRRLIWEKFARRVQTVLSVVGILVTAVSLYISPKWYIAALLVLHVGVFFVFRKLAIPSKIKNWGIVYDETNKNPVSRVVARLFNSQFNKLVDTQVTDGSGKYYFMAGDAKFYVTYEHKNYHPQKTDVINLEGKDPEAITVDVALKKS